MCGIVGVVGNRNATDILMQGLEKLEYRGYDSAGIFVADGAGQVNLVKSVGRIADLEAKQVITLQDQQGLVIHVGRPMVNQPKITRILILLLQDVSF